MSAPAIDVNSWPVNPNREIPSFKLSDYFNAQTHADKVRFGKALVAGFMEFGFVTVTDHGVSEEAIKDVYDATKKFFALPDEVKLKYTDPSGKGVRGFTPPKERAKGAAAADLKEFWHHGREMPEGDPSAERYRDDLLSNIDVAEVPELKPANDRLFAELTVAGNILLSAIALGLDLEETFFADKTQFGTSLLRNLFYPPTTHIPQDTKAVRAGAHEDINAITLLLGSEEPGLEALANVEGEPDKKEWVPVQTGGLAVNIGDMLQRLTNYKLPSTTHRVVNPTGPSRAKARYSLPYFLHFNSDMDLTALPSCVTPERPQRKPGITAGDFLHVRLFEIDLVKQLPKRLWHELEPADLARARKAGPRPSP